jgi:hypothetical protein
LNVTGALAVTTNGVEFQVNSTGVNLGNALTDSHIISGSLRVNPNGLFVSGSGLVGIGTTVPSFTLDVSGSGRFIGTLTSNARIQAQGSNGAGTSQGGFLINYNANANSRTWLINNDYNTFGDFAILQSTTQLGSTFDSKFYINPSGNVGIGTINPVQILDVRKATAGGDTQFNFVNSQNSSTGNTSITSTIYLGFNDDSSGLANVNKIVSGKLGDYTTAPNANSFLAFHTTNANTTSEKMRIINNGRVIVNSTTDRGYAFQVNGDVTSYAVEFRQSNNSATYDLLTLTHEATSGNRRMVIFNTGGYGTVGTIISTNSTTTYNTSSDYRLKEDLQDFNGLEKVSAIKVYDFKWKDSEERTNGVLAHELQEILPYAVYGEKDEVDENNKPKMQGVDYSKIVPALIKGMQEQQALITNLRTEIEELKARI